MMPWLLVAWSWLHPSADGTTLSFPADHGAHPRHRTEWWYWTGRLESPGRGVFGFQVTFFRRELPARPNAIKGPWDARDLVVGHLALGDVRGSRFRHAEASGRTAMGRARAEQHGLDVAIGTWSARHHGAKTHLSLPADGWGIDLTLRETKPPMIHGPSAYSRKSDAVDQGSRYYSQPRLEATGTVAIDGKHLPVRGAAWLDREWTSSGLGPDAVGWDWFSLTLADGRDVMLYVLRNPQGGILRVSRGSMRHPDGRQETWVPGPGNLSASATWTSPRTGIRYPSRWTLKVPGDPTPLELRPALPDQELRTRRTTGVTYWEGLVDVQRRGQPAGWGFVELTGYGAGGRPLL